MEDIKTRAKELVTKLNLPEKQKQIRELEASSMKPDFWQDSQTAAKIMKKFASLQKEISEIEMLEILEEKELEKEVNRLEFVLYLSGPYDSGDAIISLHAGQGGTEAMDWTEMLLRMYSRYIERKGWDGQELDRTSGDEAGIKSVTLEVTGSYAYGYLKPEAGVHRLVRQSSFNADNLRQTSFAMVEVYPVIEDRAVVDLKEEDLEWDFYRSGGKGGQNVNKVSTAVRLKHTPTGIIVTSQAQRYQGQNRDYALKILRAKLWELEEAKRAETEKSLRGVYKTPGWGNQIRSYVLHPYHMVKDLRTQYETSNTDRVLDGDIEDFVIAYLKKIS
ncbi:peptide chain release factor 2 [Candidatus Gottesmanbacteria bacterium RIFCSPLOWO2_01_FULL_46_21]|uniref:Peptide chain release factor 2 n=1 Tax=Candidatus Gottesmanbacteria bacterium RIFCSPLOWO2_01_FULL_46_21 TaxID=1798393 RepID=A0A1F6AZ37_9BACT|nr:MAG: peptide chain release factor 2 [Candidatus Gottesmanbacteria bacterium RIFCSPLOWO2_01_FULL_46_21]